MAFRFLIERWQKRPAHDPAETAADIGEIVGHVTHVPLGGMISRGSYRVLRWLRGLRPVRTRDEHYKWGTKLLGRSNKTVTVLSTLPAEQGPVVAAADQAMREYFISLHKIAYKNRAIPADSRRSITRYVNLDDESKCDEAVSLLYYGAGVRIVPAKLPIEFLLADDVSILVGFPNKGGQLSKGFVRIRDRDFAAAMKEWVASYAPVQPSSGHVDLETMQVNVRHSEDCMCQLIKLDRSASRPAVGKVFDQVSGWYPFLYDPEDVSAHYDALSTELKRLLRGRNRVAVPKLLDCGCGPALGARALSESFEYWGVDKSEKMIAQAQQGRTLPRRARFHQGDFFHTLLGVSKAHVPEIFSVILCEGNTFAHLLGVAQKALALYLFDRALAPGGLVAFSGVRFDLTQAVAPRELDLPGGRKEIEFRISASGNYFKLNVPGRNIAKEEERVDFFLHQISETWLRKMMSKMGYEDVNRHKTLTPRGAERSRMLIFRKGGYDATE